MGQWVTIFGAAYLLGLSVAAPIGPINVEIIRRGLTVGAVSAFFLGCGAVSADCIYFGLSITAAGLASAILQSTWGVRSALFIGGAMLVGLGAGSIRSRGIPIGRYVEIGGVGSDPRHDSKGRGEADPSLASGHGARALRAYALGLAMTLANPLTIGLWLSIAASFAAAGSGGSPWIRLGGVASGAFSWVVFIVGLTHLARRWVSPLFMRVVNLLSGIVLIGFGLMFWVKAVFG